MESFLIYAFWIGAFVLMMRFGCGAHMMGYGKGQGDRPSSPTEPPVEGTEGPKDLVWVAPERAVDPVCGEAVRPAKAKSSIYKGEVYYFCTRDCREIFEAAPQQYDSDNRSLPLKELEQANVRHGHP